MFKLNPHQQRLPIGGHHFTENGHTMRGETFAEVEDKLTDYRLNNHIPLGYPGQEILVYYAENWPYMVQYDPKAKPPEMESSYLEYRKWLNKIWKNPPVKSASVREAQDRWDICKTCPHNKLIEDESGKEFDELEKKAFLLRRGQYTPDWLGVCACHMSADLSVASFIEKPADYVEKRKDLTKPGNCWM